MGKSFVKNLFLMAFVFLFTGCVFLTNNTSSKPTSSKTNPLNTDTEESSEKYLKVTGNINGSDILRIRSQIENGEVEILDLKDAVFVASEDVYYKKDDGTEYKTEDGVLTDYLFVNCKNLKKVILPSKVSSVGRQAFCGTGLTQVEIPNNITSLGYDCFGACSSITTVVLGNKVESCSQGVFWSCGKIKDAYVKAATPPKIAAYLFSAKPVIHVYTESLSLYENSDWKKYGTIVGGLEEIYPEDMDKYLLVRRQLKNYFTDNACTSLKDEYMSMTDNALTSVLLQNGIPEYIISLAKKIKNNDWAEYEKDFRIHEYKAYSDASYWNAKLNTWNGSFMGNPTGIYCEKDEELYVFVDSDLPEDATLYFEGCVENKLIYGPTKGVPLQKGLNVVKGTKGALYYVLYTADTKSMEKKVSQWPRIKIHVEGGKVNGYYDVSRHSDSDYVKILSNATHELFTVKGEHSVFNFKTSTYRQYWPETIEKSIRWYDSLLVRELEVAGITEEVANMECAGSPMCLTGGEAIFPGYYNNPAFAIEGSSSDAGYANATNYRTSYNSSGCCSKSFDPTRSDFDDWCAAHECGHLNQGPINLEGCGEVSNNLFSNIIRFTDGFTTSSGYTVQEMMDDYANQVPFFVRDIWSMTRMYYQLYLYYHQAGHNTSFYPTLFNEFRADPMKHWDDANQSSLKFVKKVCQVAGEDLTDFFTAWGFFEPCDNLLIGEKNYTVLQKDIDATKEEISRYAKKNRGIMFIEDRVIPVPTTDFIVEAGNVRSNAGSPGKYGDLGQFSDFVQGAETVSYYGYIRSENKIAMEGSGGVGFVLRDSSGKLLYGSNSYCFTLPENIGDFTVYSVDADGSEHLARNLGSGDENVTLTQAGTLETKLPFAAISASISGPLNGSDIKYLRNMIENKNLRTLNLSGVNFVSGGEVYYTYEKDGSPTDCSLTTNDEIGTYAFYGLTNLQKIVLPLSVTKICSRAFSRSGLSEVEIPDNVTELGGDSFSYCDKLETAVVGKNVTKMGQGVFYSSKVKDIYLWPETPPKNGGYMCNKSTVIHVLAESLPLYQETSWATSGSLAGDLTE